MAHPDVESWRVDAPSRPCAFCRSNIETKEWKSCPRCEAVYHPDCWVSNSRRCAVYGCEPGLKPAVVHMRPVRPMLQPPPLPRSGPSWTWVLPILAVFVSHAARVGMSGSPTRSTVLPEPAPVILRSMPSEIEHNPPPEAVVPASLQEVPALTAEADGLVTSVSELLSMPEGRLSPEVRRMIRSMVTAEVTKLERALKLYRQCAAAQPDAALQNRIDRLRWLLLRKRSLLLEATRSMGPG